MRIALAQVDCLLNDLAGNLRLARQTVCDAAAQGADLVVFPELTLHGYPLGNRYADPLPVTDHRLQHLADESGVAVAVGFQEDGGTHTYNTTALLRPNERPRLHRKLYLPTYDIWEERKHFSPGQELRAFSTAHGRLGILTCNDAWQPFLPFLLAQDGAELLLIPANSADTRAPEVLDTPVYWRELLRSIARLNELWVVFVNRVGAQDGLHFWGGSCVVDPTGEVVAQAAERVPHLLLADLDIAAARRRRRELPLLKEARLGLLEREIRRLIAAGGDA